MTIADAHTLGDVFDALWPPLRRSYGDEVASVILALLVEVPCLED